MITHTAILAALAELRTTAEAAMTVGDNDPWSVLYDSHVVARVNGKPTYYSIAKELHTEHALHIAAWDPAHSLRWLSWAEQVAAEHGPGTLCEADCTEIRRLAGALGLEET